MFYKHGRFFVLDILARRSKPLLNKPEVDLSTDDKTGFSRLGLYLAEFIYAIAEHRFRDDDKGFLAIFRSLTDVKPFMRDVMDKLSRSDDRANNPNIPTV